MPKLIVVVGVTGLQGCSVARKFLSLPGWKVRGITRNPSGDKAKALAVEGVEIVQGDLDAAPSTLIPALTGAAAIFCNTDFFAPIWPEISNPSSTLKGEALLKHAFEREVAQNVAVAEAAAAPEVLATLERFVLSYLTDSTKASKGKYTNMYHFDSKAEAARQIEARFPQVHARMNYLLMGHYTNNVTLMPFMWPQKQEDGSYLIARSVSATTWVPFINVPRDTGEFAWALVEHLKPGTTLLGASQIMTWPEFTSLWGELLGVKAEYKQVTGREIFKGLPSPVDDEIIRSFDFWNEFGFVDDSTVVFPDQLDTKLSLTSMEDFIKNEDWSAVL
ncbi:uncharacterized protein B0I36DRAFT_243122 [Microdochium trichocladiopsis]|uniref:NmrA-like domain-containing protein n=1 Tax=Microdochium trichocladiopsis TaxID=1682393 RepID=A0A9P8Y657_9PEZI|nr:uncharacterized protein B0I36DRAFT_243122 [Microdochium trichocladiopsis]KAH7030687.1 hypothetical protein B0I36DRAFT_243122 [Microdochium trichocladiopsis]